MPKMARLFILTIAITLSLSGLGIEANAERNEYQSLSPLVKELSPSVVNISTTSVSKGRNFSFQSPFGGDEQGDQFQEFFKRYFGDSPQQEFKRKGLGSGFVFSEDGYIITNNHVVERATDIKVIMQNGDSYKAEIIGTDPKTDLALF